AKDGGTEAALVHCVRSAARSCPRAVASEGSAECVEHDPDLEGRVSARCAGASLATNAERLRGDHAYSKKSSAMAIQFQSHRALCFERSKQRRSAGLTSS